ncbi:MULTISPECIES: hypothetical protein [Trichocoleus]|uniref:Uncharacterized protein n=1 Tax=Trichocoleus desertorum GB2-A4 TaxID=2933944 RepID=A0ABV0JCZ3_9CYAN|nr:hypothetical protein [Trichocoleus sp. FACHB-46]MBD1864300.1 hypothetical protein [Trichocoleus sp. FACHB-46]
MAARKEPQTPTKITAGEVKQGDRVKAEGDEQWMQVVSEPTSQGESSSWQFMYGESGPHIWSGLKSAELLKQ